MDAGIVTPKRPTEKPLLSQPPVWCALCLVRPARQMTGICSTCQAAYIADVNTGNRNQVDEPVKAGA